MDLIWMMNQLVDEKGHIWVEGTERTSYCTEPPTERPSYYTEPPIEEPSYYTEPPYESPEPDYEENEETDFKILQIMVVKQKLITILPHLKPIIILLHLLRMIAIQEMKSQRI